LSSIALASQRYRKKNLKYLLGKKMIESRPYVEIYFRYTFKSIKINEQKRGHFKFVPTATRRKCGWDMSNNALVFCISTYTYIYIHLSTYISHCGPIAKTPTGF